MSTTRISYDASEIELTTLHYLKDQLQQAFGKHQRVTSADAMTYALLIASELIEESPTYTSVMPHSYHVADTRLERFFNV